jgi:small GTP-binding protein
MLEREMLEALPLAKTEEAIRVLLDQPRRWHEFLKSPKPALQGRVREILDNRSLWWMLHPPKIAIVGLPNVGKSTLANHLFGQRRSITADLPGTTRDWVGDWANIDGLPVQLIDTPGQRDSTDPIEQAAIAASRPQIDRADLVILVLDPTIPLQPEQAALRAKYSLAISVINKSDLAPTWEQPLSCIRTIATNGDGLDRLRDRIREHFDLRTQARREPCWWTLRQHAALQRTLFDPAALHEIGVTAH